MITITIDGIPIGQGNISRNRYGAAYEKTKDHAPWRESIIWAAREAWGGAEPWPGPVSITAVFTFNYLKSHRTTKGALKDNAPTYKTTKPDTDHLQRSVGDALVLAGCMHDDAQIAHWDATKVFGLRPGAVLKLTVLEG